MSRYDYGSNNKGTGLLIGKSPEEYTRIDHEKRVQQFGDLKSQQDNKTAVLRDMHEAANLRSLEQSLSNRFPYEATQLSKKVETDLEYEKRMIELISSTYGNGITPSEEEKQELRTFLLNFSPDDRQRLIKRIQNQKWSELMQNTHSQSPIHLDRLSLTQQQKLKEKHVDDSAKSLSPGSSGSPGSFPVGGPKYLMTESDIRLNEMQRRKDYASQLFDTSSMAEVAMDMGPYTPLRQKAEVGKTRGGGIDFKTMCEIDFVADKGNHNLSELQSTLSLPLAYRKTIGEMKCYFNDVLE